MADTPLALRLTLDADHATRRAEVHAALVAGHPGRPCLTPGQALEILGVHAAGIDDAARQRMSRGTYPFPVATVGGRNVVMLIDIAAVLASAPRIGVVAEHDAPAANDPEPPPEPVRRRRGRPRKTAQQREKGVDHA